MLGHNHTRLALVCHLQIDLSHRSAIVHCQEQLKKGHRNPLTMSQSGSMGANTQAKLIESHVKMKIWEARRRWVAENIERMYEIEQERNRQIKRWREDLLQIVWRETKKSKKEEGTRE